MPSRQTDSLFQLIKSLKKSEKRNFKLYATRNTSSESLKTVILFDAIDKAVDYEDDVLIKKTGSTRLQLANHKAILYKQILSSLRILKDEANIEMQLREQMDFARILYSKGLYLQSLRILDKVKEQATFFSQLTYLQQALFFEKKIEALYITRSFRNRADELCQQANEIMDALTKVNTYSNLALQLYSWYIQHGHARDEEDVIHIKKFFEKHVPVHPPHTGHFYEMLYYHQSYCWYAFIRQDFLQYYRHTQHWVDLFHTRPEMKAVETALYIKGMHNLMGAHFDLNNPLKLDGVINEFEEFSSSGIVASNENNRILAFVYLYISKINSNFLKGTFAEGITLVPFIMEKLQEYNSYLDIHRVLVFYYKIACLYFGAGNSEKAIDYLNKIINHKADLRTDLQCYSRLLHLIAHYELGNFTLLNYLSKSVYRFMAKMGNLSKVEEEVFAFLRRSFAVGAHAIKPEFQRLLAQLKQYEGNPLESRAFAYLDIISWLESKIEGIHVQDIIRRKHQHKQAL